MVIIAKIFKKKVMIFPRGVALINAYYKTFFSENI